MNAISKLKLNDTEIRVKDLLAAPRRGLKVLLLGDENASSIATYLPNFGHNVTDMSEAGAGFTTSGENGTFLQQLTSAPEEHYDVLLIVGGKNDLLSFNETNLFLAIQRLKQTVLALNIDQVMIAYIPYKKGENDPNYTHCGQLFYAVPTWHKIEGADWFVRKFDYIQNTYELTQYGKNSVAVAISRYVGDMRPLDYESAVTEVIDTASCDAALTTYRLYDRAYMDGSVSWIGSKTGTFSGYTEIECCTLTTSYVQDGLLRTAACVCTMSDNTIRDGHVLYKVDNSGKLLIYPVLIIAGAYATGTITSLTFTI